MLRDARLYSVLTAALGLSALGVALSVGTGASQIGEASASVEIENWNGFVADSTCADCHAAITESFQTLGMARSFAKPSNARWVEDFTAPGVRDGRLTYRITRSGDRLMFTQWQTAPDGAPIHRFEREIDWVLGSGSNSRVYLVQSGDGTLLELPIAWYSQTGAWGAKPGGDRGDDEAGMRLVQRGCMFCHTGVPTDPHFEDDRFAAPAFPSTLPEGIGCQRCHGPGLTHVEKAREVTALRAAESEALTSQQRRDLRDALRSTIVQPEDLAPQARRDVCAQCHHQPSVSVFGQRHLDRADYEFSAGQQLKDFLLKLEVVERNREGQIHGPEDRFEINHHGYRLEQSACFVQSAAGALECTSCHDPHSKPPRPETLSRTRSACLSCHTNEDTASPVMIAGQPQAQHLQQTDCVTCHMPRRRTQDVVQVVMTDHRIQRQPSPEAERLAALPDRTTFPVEVRPLYSVSDQGSDEPSDSTRTTLDELTLASGSIRMGFNAPAASLGDALAAAESAMPGVDLSEPQLRLAQAQLGAGRLDAARKTLEALMAKSANLQPDAAQQARVWLAMVAARQNQRAEALSLIDEAIELQTLRPGAPRSAALFQQRGRLRLWAGQQEAACLDFEMAVELNEFLARAWEQVGRCKIATREYPQAAQALGQALSLEPELQDAARPLVAVLAALGREDEASRVILHHGLE